MVPPACTPTAGATTPWPGGTSRSGSRTASWTGPWRPAVTPLFVNRTKELAALTRWWATQEQAADCVKAESQRTLERLIELGLVERVMPVGESERSKRRLEGARAWCWFESYRVILKAVKTAVSIPEPLFRAADRLARRLGLSRSELYARALERLVDGEPADEVTSRLDEVYATEDSRVDDDLARAQGRAVAESW